MARTPKIDERSASFFKILIGDFTNILRIPPAFIKHLGIKSSKTFILRYAERSWNVKAKIIGESWFLEQGWSDFVSKNFLEYGDFLVFTTQEGSDFDVKVFGKNGCEKTIILIEEEDGNKVQNENKKKILPPRRKLDRLQYYSTRSSWRNK